MRIDISMGTEGHKFTVASWWATGPSFVLDALYRQLTAAKVIWPEELGDIHLTSSGKSVEKLNPPMVNADGTAIY